MYFFRLRREKDLTTTPYSINFRKNNEKIIKAKATRTQKKRVVKTGQPRFLQFDRQASLQSGDNIEKSSMKKRKRGSSVFGEFSGEKKPI